MGDKGMKDTVMGDILITDIVIMTENKNII